MEKFDAYRLNILYKTVLALAALLNTIARAHRAVARLIANGIDSLVRFLADPLRARLLVYQRNPVMDAERGSIMFHYFAR
jgi:hypothetical protein